MDKVVHFEIPGNDIARVNKFYSTVFGWDIHPIPEMEYNIATTVECDEQRMPKEVGAINGGIMKRTELQKSPTIVIKVDSIDASMQKVTGNGGKILQEKKPVGEMGFYGLFQDTEGNVMGIWEDKT